MRFPPILAAALLLAACHTTSGPAATSPSPSPTAAPSGPLTDAELDFVAGSLGCKDVHRADRIVRMTCGDESRNVSLANLDRQLEDAKPADRIPRALAFFSLGSPSAGAITAERGDEVPWARLVPLLKSRAALQAAIDRFPPQAQGITIPMRPLAGDAVIALGIDSDRSIETVTSQHLGKWKVDAGDLAQRAVQNLASRPSPAPVDVSDGGSKTFLINSGDSYDAARLLVPEARLRLEEALGGTAVYAIPDRDHLLAVRADDDAAVAALHARAAKLYRGAPYAITDELIRYDEGKFFVVR